MLSFFSILITICCFIFVLCWIFFKVDMCFKKHAVRFHKSLAFSVLIVSVFVMEFLVFTFESHKQVLQNFLVQMHSSKDTGTITNLVCSLITLCLVNMIFDSPNWFEFLQNYQLKDNTKIAKSIVQIFTFASTPALFLWQKGTWQYGTINCVSFTGLFFYYLCALIVSVLIFATISCLFKSEKVRSIFLQPKSTNFASLSSNHYDIDDLIKAEQQIGDDPKAKSMILNKKIQELSFNNDNKMKK